MRNNAIYKKNESKRHLHTLAAISISILLTLSLVACGSSEREVNPQFPDVTQNSADGSIVDLRPNRLGDDLDTRASASQTFGGAVLIDVQSQSEPVEAADVLNLTPGDTIMSLPEYMIAFSKAKTEFEQHLGSALTQAELQTSYENEVIRMDTLEIADLFVILAAWELGEEATLDLWETAVGDGSWTLDTEEEDNWFHLLFSNNGTPEAEFLGRWYEGDQYLYSVFNTNDYTLEMDIMRTEYGFACQLYEPGTPGIYRFSFANDGSWDSGIGFLFGITEQPDVLTGMETLAYAKDWPEPGVGQPTWILIKGTTLTVSQSSAEKNYPIDTGAAVTTATPSASSEPENNTGETNYHDAAVTIAQDTTNSVSQPALSAEAVPYSRLWHGSPVLGSGWSERFALFDDGSFIWGANEMDGATRLRYLAGTWNVKDDQLTLNCKLVIGWEGGEVVQNTGIESYGSNEVILNPTVVVSQIEDTFVLPVNQITHDNERSLDTVMLNELQCWDYSGQADDAISGFWQSFMTSWNRAPEPKSKTMPTSGVK